MNAFDIDRTIEYLDTAWNSRRPMPDEDRRLLANDLGRMPIDGEQALAVLEQMKRSVKTRPGLPAVLAKLKPVVDQARRISHERQAEPVQADRELMTTEEKEASIRRVLAAAPTPGARAFHKEHLRRFLERHGMTEPEQE